MNVRLIHSHSGATGVFRHAFREIVAQTTSCFPETLQTKFYLQFCVFIVLNLM